MIDITDGAMIAAAVKTVEQVVAERGLAGLVNNAGIVKPGPLELQPLDDFRRQLEVNLIGPLAVIQAFLPLIRRGGGRIVNVGSIGGLLVLPIQGAYSASKFGLEALSDALRLELRQWKIPVSHVDPGVTDTPIFGKTLVELDRALDALHERGHDEYDAQFAAIRKMVEKSPDSAAPAGRPGQGDRAGAHRRQAEDPLPRGARLQGGVRGRPHADRPRQGQVVAREVGLPKPEQDEHERKSRWARRSRRSCSSTTPSRSRPSMVVEAMAQVLTARGCDRDEVRRSSSPTRTTAGDSRSCRCPGRS